MFTHSLKRKSAQSLRQEKELFSVTLIDIGINAIDAVALHRAVTIK